MRTILLAVLAAVLVGTFAAYLYNPPVRQPLVDTSEEPVADQEGKPRVKGLTYTQVENGIKKWTLSAQGAKYDEKEEIVTLEQVKMIFYPEKGGWVEIVSNTGDYNRKQKVVILTGAVKGKTDDGLTLTTDKISYSENTQEVDTDHVVNISGANFKVRGRGMRVKVAENRLLLKNEVDSTFIPAGQGPPKGVTAELPDNPESKPEGGGLSMRPLSLAAVLTFSICLMASGALAATLPQASDEPIHVVADQLEVDNKAQVAQFTGAVKATQGDVTITCDQLEVYYEREGGGESMAQEATQGLADEGGQVRKVVALGHVQIKQKDRTAVGRKATYWAGGRKILLEGQATVWRGESQVSGDKITVFLDQDRSVVHGKPGKRVAVTIAPQKKKD